MTDIAKKSSFWGNLFSRRVPHILGLYLAACWGIIEFVNWTVDTFVLSDLLPQFTFIALLCMLPTVFIIAYFHGLPGKNRWTMVEKLGVPANIVLTAVILFSVFGGG